MCYNMPYSMPTLQHLVEIDNRNKFHEVYEKGERILSPILIDAAFRLVNPDSVPNWVGVLKHKYIFV